MRVLVVGAGTMGRWFGDLVDARVAFADADPAAADRAAEAVDDAETTPLDPETPAADADADAAGRRFDVVCVAVPMTVAADVIARQASRATSAVVDVAGEMGGPVNAMREHAPDLERLSLHPLFAPENAPGTIAAVHDQRGPVTDALRESLAANGNDVFDTTVDEHDTAMESVQAATHAAILAWQLATDDVREEFHTPLSRELADLAAHVTSQEPRVYADIADRYAPGRQALADAAARLADADHDAFLDAFADASERAHDDDTDHR
ncbi:prephenate dehydrogenase/arogenate dehydrogenase family protein [Halorubellus salinus]|uniref:prephenate dehydrogenase/arogenate dehydrogenase family protein n=1 Tax=Halorubellus salinus TaxID=755309 RepID=UPI001D099473|nr:prephenate dehydrogenase/arogenate dehydrogenase family protein [Halorubellus salinus]